MSTAPQAHIAVVDVGAHATAVANELERAKVKALITGTRLRVGVHFFNDVDDVDRALEAMSAARRN